MKLLLILALVALACCNVVTVTSENWDEVSSTPAFVKFYAPWCGHCKSLAPIWEELADSVAEQELVIGEIDCTENEELCRQFEVRGYPTLIYIEGEAQVTYNGPRELTDLSTWVVAMMGPAVEEVETVEAETPIYFVNTGVSALFDEVANTHKGQLVFYRTPTFAGVPADSIAVVREDEIVVFTGETAEEFTEFVGANRFPFLPELGPSNFRDLVSVPDAKLVILLVDPADEMSAEAISEYRKYAKTHPDAAFTHSWINGVQWVQFAKQYEVESSDYPAVLVLDLPERKYWKGPASTRTEMLSGITAGTLAGTEIGGARPATHAQQPSVLSTLTDAWTQHKHTAIIAGAVLAGIVVVLSVSKADKKEEAEEEKPEEKTEEAEVEAEAETVAEEKEEEKTEEVAEEEEEVVEDAPKVKGKKKRHA